MHRSDRPWRWWCSSFGRHLPRGRLASRSSTPPPLPDSRFSVLCTSCVPGRGAGDDAPCRASTPRRVHRRSRPTAGPVSGAQAWWCLFNLRTQVLRHFIYCYCSCVNPPVVVFADDRSSPPPPKAFLVYFSPVLLLSCLFLSSFLSPCLGRER